MFLVPHEP